MRDVGPEGRGVGVYGRRGGRGGGALESQDVGGDGLSVGEGKGGHAGVGDAFEDQGDYGFTCSGVGSADGGAVRSARAIVGVAAGAADLIWALAVEGLGGGGG